MIINWIGQALGFGQSSDTGRTMEPLLRSPVIDEPAPLASVVDPPDLLHKELERARRYERGLSVSVLTVEPLNPREDETLDGDGDARGSSTMSGPPQVVALLAAAGLRDLLRQSDVLCYQPTENRFVLAFAESDAEEAEKALVRISGIFRQRLELGVQAGIARFPDDALTLAGLIDSAASDPARTGAVPRTNGQGTSAGSAGDGVAAGNGDGIAAGNGDGVATVNGDGVAAVNGDRRFGKNGQRRPRRVAPLEVNDDE